MSPTVTHRGAAPEHVAADVAQRIVDALEEVGFSQSRLARLLVDADSGAEDYGTRVASTRRLLHKWMRGQHLPSPEYSRKLAGIFGKPEGYFAPENDSNGFVTAGSAQLRVDEALGLLQAAIRCQAPSFDVSPANPLDREEIAKLAPHFNPDLILIDYITELVPGVKVVAHTQFESEGWRLQPLWTGTEMIPAVIIIEALAQAAGVGLLLMPINAGTHYGLCAGLDRFHFRRIVEAGDSITLECSAFDVREVGRGLIAHVNGMARHANGDIAARGSLTIALQ